MMMIQLDRYVIATENERRPALRDTLLSPERSVLPALPRAGLGGQAKSK